MRICRHPLPISSKFKHCVLGKPSSRERGISLLLGCLFSSSDDRPVKSAKIDSLGMDIKRGGLTRKSIRKSIIINAELYPHKISSAAAKACSLVPVLVTVPSTRWGPVFPPFLRRRVRHRQCNITMDKNVKSMDCQQSLSHGDVLSSHESLNGGCQ